MYMYVYHTFTIGVGICSGHCNHLSTKLMKKFLFCRLGSEYLHESEMLSYLSPRTPPLSPSSLTLSLSLSHIHTHTLLSLPPSLSLSCTFALHTD